MLWHLAAASLVALAAGFAGGWQVHAWKTGAAEADDLRETQRLSRIAQDRSKENADGLRKDLERVRARAASGDAHLVRMRIALDELSAAADGGLDPDGELLAEGGRLLAEGGGLAQEGRRLSGEIAAQASRLQTQLGLMCLTADQGTTR